MKSAQFNNMIISVVLAAVVQFGMSWYMGTEDPIYCAPGVNEFNWNASYLSPSVYPPSSLTRTSTYIRGSNGTELAADIYISDLVEKLNQTVPTIVHVTRFGRAFQLDFPFSLLSTFKGTINPRTQRTVNRFISHGYAWVTIDVRGTGASFGAKTIDFSDTEVEDARAVLDWIVKQPWSNGNVGSYALGFEGLGNVLLAATGHPAMKAVVLNGAPVDLYNDALFPGGVLNSKTLKSFQSYISSAASQIRWTGNPSMKSSLMMRYFGGNVVPVSQQNTSALSQAVAQHAENVDTEAQMASVECRDDPSFAKADVLRVLEKIKSKNVALYSFGGYFDMGTARSSIKLFKTMPESTRVTLGPWSHAGVDNADPFAKSKQRCFQHIVEILKFFDSHLFSNRETGLLADDRVQYFTMVQNQWHGASEWPPSRMAEKTLYVGYNNSLVSVLHQGDAGGVTQPLSISYNSTSTSATSRWDFMNHIFTIRPEYYGNRETTDDKLSFTTSPLKESMEITGSVILKLFISVNTSDVALQATLEDVDFTSGWEGVAPKEGEGLRRRGVTYVTEGIVRPKHRAGGEDATHRSFNRADMKDLATDGTVEEVVFEFLPASYMIRRGNQLRVTIAAVDSRDFKVATTTATELKVHYGATYPTSVTVPMAPVSEEDLSEASVLLENSGMIKPSKIVLQDEFSDNKDEL